MIEQTPNKNILGVIGGMGIDTSHRFVKKLVAEHPTIPIRYAIARHHGLDPSKEPEYIQKGLFKRDFENVVVHAAVFLAEEGATHVVLICNTAHEFETAIRTALEPFQTKFLSIVEAVTSGVKENNLSKVLLMATSSTTFGIGLYDSVPNIVKPSFEDQQLIDTVILKILRKEIKSDDIEKLVSIAVKHDCDGFLFACTDLAVVMDQFEKQLKNVGQNRKVLESTQALEKLVISKVKG